MLFANIGYGNIISANRIVAIISPDSAPTKRIIQDAKENKCLIDGTHGRKTKSVIIMDSGHIILSALEPDKINKRFLESKPNSEDVEFLDYEE